MVAPVAVVLKVGDRVRLLRGTIPGKITKPVGVGSFEVAFAATKRSWVVASKFLVKLV